LRPDIFLVDLPELFAQAMRFDADDGVRGGVEVLLRPAENFGGDRELRKLLFLLLKILRAQVLEQTSVSSAPAQKFDGPLQFLPFSVV
jgi:hypothetical protein